jgi:pimeloyl-ACP methyl ester carboxylesterase
LTARPAPRSPRRRAVLAATEPARTLMSAGALAAGFPLLTRAPRGEPHPVLVLPGLMASDVSTQALRAWLRRLGYPVVGWALGRNRGPTEQVISELPLLVDRLAREHGTSVSIVGWSLGGIYARELAKLHPSEARCVITLGTPFTGHPKATNAWRLYELLSRSKVGDAELMAEIRKPPPVPTTSIYSRSDGIVSWRCSLNDAGPLVENIEVPASHVGMGTNPLVLYAVADRLAQPIGQWRRFDVSGARRWFFRSALPEAIATAG